MLWIQEAKSGFSPHNVIVIVPRLVDKYFIHEIEYITNIQWSERGIFPLTEPLAIPYDPSVASITSPLLQASSQTRHERVWNWL